MAPHRVRDGRVTRYLGVQKDVTERVAAAARIHRLAHFDHLTGLPNRATLHDELRSALHRARVHDLQVALLAIDLDDFKRVNDRHGHHVGDALLRAVAERLRGVVRPSDVLARQGVDEVAAFGVGLPDEPPPGVRGAQLDADDAVRSAAGRGSRRRTAMPLRGGARTMPGAAGEAAGREGEGDRGAGRPRPRVARHEGRPNGRATRCPARRGGEGPAPLHGRARARGCPGATRGWGARRAGCAACRPGLAARA